MDNKEQRVFDRWFQLADVDKDGKVSGSEAFSFFMRSNLQTPALAKVWDLCATKPPEGSNEPEYLAKHQFYASLRLISLAQASGGDIMDSEAKALLSGLGKIVPPPTLSGLEEDIASLHEGEPPVARHGFGSMETMATPMNPRGGGSGFPPLTPVGMHTPLTPGGVPLKHTTPMQPAHTPGHPPLPLQAGPPGAAPGGGLPPMPSADSQRYHQFWSELNQSGSERVPGGECAQLFQRWGLSKEVLREVWDVVAGRAASSLSYWEFTSALYLMECAKRGHPVPSYVPKDGSFPPSAKAIPMGNPQGPPDGWGQGGDGGGGGGRPPFSGAGAVSAQGFTGPTYRGDRLGASSVHGVMENFPPHPSTAPSGAPGEWQYQPSVPTPLPEQLAQLQGSEQERVQMLAREAGKIERESQELAAGAMSAQQRKDFYEQSMKELLLFRSRASTVLLEVQEKIERETSEAGALQKQYEQRYAAMEGMRRDVEAAAQKLDEMALHKAAVLGELARLEQAATEGPQSERVQREMEEIRQLEERQMEMEQLIEPLEEAAAQRRHEREMLEKELYEMRMSTTAGEIELENEVKQVESLQRQLDEMQVQSQTGELQRLAEDTAKLYNQVSQRAARSGIPMVGGPDSLQGFGWKPDMAAGAEDDWGAFKDEGLVVVETLGDDMAPGVWRPAAMGSVSHNRASAQNLLRLYGSTWEGGGGGGLFSPDSPRVVGGRGRLKWSERENSSREWEKHNLGEDEDRSVTTSPTNPNPCVSLTRGGSGGADESFTSRLDRITEVKTPPRGASLASGPQSPGPGSGGGGAAASWASFDAASTSPALGSVPVSPHTRDALESIWGGASRGGSVTSPNGLEMTFGAGFPNVPEKSLAGQLGVDRGGAGGDGALEFKPMGQKSAIDNMSEGGSSAQGGRPSFDLGDSVGGSVPGVSSTGRPVFDIKGGSASSGGRPYEVRRDITGGSASNGVEGDAFGGGAGDIGAVSGGGFGDFGLVGGEGSAKASPTPAPAGSFGVDFGSTGGNPLGGSASSSMMGGLHARGGFQDMSAVTSITFADSARSSTNDVQVMDGMMMASTRSGPVGASMPPAPTSFPTSFEDNALFSGPQPGSGGAAQPGGFGVSFQPAGGEGGGAGPHMAAAKFLSKLDAPQPVTGMELSDPFSDWPPASSGKGSAPPPNPFAEDDNPFGEPEGAANPFGDLGFQ